MFIGQRDLRQSSSSSNSYSSSAVKAFENEDDSGRQPSTIADRADFGLD